MISTRLLWALALSVMASPCFSASVLVRTPDTHGVFVQEATFRLPSTSASLADPGAGFVEVMLDTRGGSVSAGTCRYSLALTRNRYPSLVAELIVGAQPIQRRYKPATVGVIELRLEGCTDSSGNPQAAAAPAIVEVYSPGVAPVNAECGAGAGVQSPVPAAADLCSQGSPASMEDGTGGGAWTCIGKFGGTNAACTAPR